MVILKRNYLSIENIRHGLNAFALICREPPKQDYLMMEKSKIHRAMRLINLSISDNILNFWMDHVKSNIEWSKKERRRFEAEHKETKVDIPFLFPHEFLFLLCNSLNRLESIRRLHKPDLSSNMGDVYQWEISDGKSMKVMHELNQIRHLHLLNKDAFDNKDPQ